MKKLRKVTILLVCLVMLVCLSSVYVSAATGSDSDSVKVRSSSLITYTANANLKVTETSAMATTNYGGIADNLVINLNVLVRNTISGEKNTEIYLANDENSSYTFKSASAGTNEEFTSAGSYHRVITVFDDKIMDLSASVF